MNSIKQAQAIDVKYDQYRFLSDDDKLLVMKQWQKKQLNFSNFSKYMKDAVEAEGINFCGFYKNEVSTEYTITIDDKELQNKINVLITNNEDEYLNARKYNGGEMWNDRDVPLLMAVTIKESILGIKCGYEFNISAKEDYMLRKVNWDKKLTTFVKNTNYLNEILGVHQLREITVGDFIKTFLLRIGTRYKQRRVPQMYEGLASTLWINISSKPVRKRMYGNQYSLCEITENFDYF